MFKLIIMADNIFDAQRDRRLQNLKQSQVSNIVRRNPNLRGVLTRYEDAEVSRIKLLELQQMRSSKVSKGERALLKALTKGRRGGRGGRAPKQKKEVQAKEPPEKSQTQIEVDAEEKRERMRQDKVKLSQQDRFLELEDFRQQRDFITADRNRQQTELQRLDTFTSGQNRLIADANIAQFNQAQENLREQGRNVGNQALQRLEGERIDLQARQIGNRQDRDRESRAVEYARLDNDRERYNSDVQRAEVERDGAAIRADAELQGIRERVAGDNARQHAELQAQQEQFMADLRQRGLDNTHARELEARRIDHQRSVDAERAITDREKEQTLQSTLDALHRAEEPRQLPTGRGLVEDVNLTGGSSGSDGPQAQDVIVAALNREASDLGEELRRSTSEALAGLDDSLRQVNSDGSFANPSLPSSYPPHSPVSQERVEAALDRTSSARERSATARGIREGSFTPSEDVAAQQFYLQTLESGSSGDPSSEETESHTGSTLSSSTESSHGHLGPDLQRSLSIQSGSPSPGTRGRRADFVEAGTAGGGSIRVSPPRTSPSSLVEKLQEQTGVGTFTGEASPRQRFDRSGRARSPTPPSGLTSVPEQDSPMPRQPSFTPSIEEGPGTPRRGGASGSSSAGSSSSAEEEFLPGVTAAAGVIGGGLAAAGRFAGGAVGGVAQGVYEQLPAASDVGAAVGRGGVRAAGGVASAVYQGLSGTEPEPQPTRRGGTPPRRRPPIRPLAGGGDAQSGTPEDLKVYFQREGGGGGI